MSKRLTMPGPLITSMAELDKALEQPCIYWHEKPNSSAFMVNISFAILRNLIEYRYLRWALYLPQQPLKHSRSGICCSRGGDA